MNLPIEPALLAGLFGELEVPPVLLASIARHQANLAARLGKNSTALAIRRPFSALRCSRPLRPLRSGAQKRPPGGALRRLWLGTANSCSAAALIHSLRAAGVTRARTEASVEALVASYRAELMAAIDAVVECG